MMPRPSFCAAIVWLSVNRRTPAAPWRRPRPDCFMPPIGDATLPQPIAYASLTTTVPAAIRRAIRVARRRSLLHTEAFRPYGVSLANFTAAASDATRYTD